MTTSTSVSTATAADLEFLLQRIQQGDQNALAELCRQSRSRLIAVIRRVVRDEALAEEVIQDVFLYVWRNAARYSPDRGSPIAWMFMIARSRAIDTMRRDRRRTSTAQLDDHVQYLTEQPGPPAETWLHTIVRKGVHQLPSAQQTLIAMAFVDGYTHVEIAHSTGLPLGTVKGRIRVALTKLGESVRDQMLQKRNPARRSDASARGVLEVAA